MDQGIRRALDRKELDEKIRRYHVEAYGWALSCCCNDAGQAEDVLQQVYLKILDGRAVYGGKSRFRTWLFAVIRYTAKDSQRHRWLRSIRLDRLKADSGSVSGTPAAALPDQELMAQQYRVQFRHALAALPPRQRQVLQLVFYHDLTIQEAAEVMGVSLGSARTHYDRGKKQMHRILSQIEA